VKMFGAGKTRMIPYGKKKLRRYVKPFASDIVTLRTDGQADIYKQICYINIARQSADTYIHGLSNRAIFNDLERPQTQISRSGHCLTLNIYEMAKDTAIVTMEGE